MDRAGYSVVNLDGGVIAWKRDGFDFVAEDGGPGRVA
jgi:rhodanese-related sulfurtransferase